ncbi:hypothetical protein [Glycomyces lechevalierae]|uniref:Uncharacterized protein n=1 Tax=Glycomyces lechevalierae TaxID=256034 RepID=A0A9X3PNH3_9ACTN|nr:hypothetical protein [Glycomyces lechevalierae]MDA1386257.1 hypothetical protein [Glycomyces lechevalierae]MDR7338270.1 hypothetical protein [Glycomyces lechevalierae]
MRPNPRALNPQTFEVEGQQYELAEYRNDMGGPHLKVTELSEHPFTVMTRGLEYGERPFWIGGYAIGQPELREHIAAAVAALHDGPATTGRT